MPYLSLVTGYRDREIPRIERFLESLARQTWKDFELIFVDYGSSAAASERVATLCSHYHFCTYIFCDSRDMVWNRAHALNIGIKAASGKYFLSADVDLIYSDATLALLAANCTENLQIFCRAYLLPPEFSSYDVLLNLPLSFEKTDRNTRGLFHCVLMDHVRSAHGYDEYFKVWGFEDRDFSERLAEADLEVIWLNETQCPIYHQWHPKGSEHMFMPWMWQDMTIHYARTRGKELNQREWGKLISGVDRGLNQSLSVRSFRLPSSGNRFERRELMVEVVAYLETHPMQPVEMTLFSRGDHRNRSQRFTLKYVPLLLKFIRSMFSERRPTLRTHPEEETRQAYLYFLYVLIFKTAIISDYRIQEFPERLVITILSNHGNT